MSQQQSVHNQVMQLTVSFLCCVPIEPDRSLLKDFVWCIPETREGRITPTYLELMLMRW